MTVIPRCLDDYIARPIDGDCAFAFRNIDTNCVHEPNPFE